MLLNPRSIAFSDTQFRPSFAQPLPGSGINLRSTVRLADLFHNA
jgi:hypothetical protein